MPEALEDERVFAQGVEAEVELLDPLEVRLGVDGRDERVAQPRVLGVAEGGGCHGGGRYTRSLISLFVYSINKN